MKNYLKNMILIIGFFACLGNVLPSKSSNALNKNDLTKIVSHFKKCWKMEGGAMIANDLIVQIRIWSNPDGTIRDAEIVDKNRYEKDPYFKFAAENALRAAKDPHCAKLPLPLAKYELWKDLILNFDPRNAWRVTLRL